MASGWKLGKKLKEGGSSLLSSAKASSSTPTPSQASRSTTPTPGNPNPEAASAVDAPGNAPVARSGILKIRVTAARGLSLPSGVNVPSAVQSAVSSHPSIGSSLSSSPSVLTNPRGNRESLQRKQVWWLPYVVLEFDRNEILIDALGGDLGGPVWMYSATFDVSRVSEIAITSYLRTAAPSASKDGADMGQGDLSLGVIRFTPDFDSGRLMDDWIDVQGGSGQIHVQVSFKAAQAPLSIDSFELLRVIGKGSFGKVMQVRKRDTARVYALKTIRKAHIVARSEERFVLARVSCPFITPLKFSFQSPDKLYLVLAFVNGGELFHHLQKEGRFSEARARFYAAELLLALEHLHSLDVIYRDLKPENILLDYSGHLSLCDFGLCKVDMKSGDTTNTFCGTPEYLSPELLSGNGYTKTVDWWTLGVLVYEMISGLPPYYSENTNEMYKRILHDPLRFGDEFSADARSILTQLLDRNPATRLGVNGAQDIRNHPFFSKHIDFRKLWAKQIKPPFKPAVASAIDTSNFDEEFTSEVPQDSVAENSHLSSTVQQQFEGFSWSVSPLGESVGRY